jgi:hypothetical protein
MRAISDYLQEGISRGKSMVAVVSVNETTGEYLIREVLKDGLLAEIEGGAEGRQFILPYAGIRSLRFI